MPRVPLKLQLHDLGLGTANIFPTVADHNHHTCTFNEHKVMDTGVIGKDEIDPMEMEDCSGSV
jgi:hypothetical protein